MTNTPSPVYFLLSTPASAWVGKGGRGAQIAQGLREWNYDPNEQHNDTPLLRAMLEHVSGIHIQETELVEVVQVLLDRGANPESAFGPGKAAIQWQNLPSVKRLLTQALMPEETATIDPRGAWIFTQLREQGSPHRIMASVQVKLGERLLQERLDGLNAGAWIALHATPTGEALPGWCIPHRAYGGGEAVVARIARKAVVEAKLLQSGTDLDRVVAAWGLVSAVATFGNNQEDKAARDAAIKAGYKVLQGLDSGRILAQAATESILSREQKTRLGIAMLRAASILLDPARTWDVIVDAWPLLQDPRLDLSYHSVKPIFSSGLPTHALDRLPRTDQNQQILMDLLAASLNRFGPTHENGWHEKRVAFIEQMGRWRAGHDLPQVDRKRFTALIGTNDAALMHGVEQAVDAMMLDSCTPQKAPGSRPQRRL